MATKNIAIMDDVYRMLLLRRQGEESFSDILRRTLSKKRDIMRLAGSWKGIDDKDINLMKERIRKLRETSTQELKNDWN